MRSSLNRSPEPVSNVMRLDRRPFGSSIPPPLPPRVQPEKVLPVKRLAALLLILSRTNTYEGRDARLIADDLTCGFVTGTLSLDLQSLTSALTQLSGMGLISPAANGGLRIDDLDGLERFCD